MVQEKIKGLGVALVTPFNKDGSIDEESLVKLVNHISEGRADYLVVLGTTAETPVLNKTEKQRICEIVKSTNKGKKPLVIGIGANDTRKTIESISKTDLSGFDAILSVVPYYNKPSQEGIYRHFKEIAENSPLPLILYNVPGRTGVNMKPDTTLRLANDCKNIVAIKEAAGTVAQMDILLREKPEDFLVLSGDDTLAFPHLTLGADGLISVAANLFVKEMASLVSDCMNGKILQGREMHRNLERFFRLLFEDGNPAGIKCALSKAGFIENCLRLPLVPVNHATEEKIESFVNNNFFNN